MEPHPLHRQRIALFLGNHRPRPLTGERGKRPPPPLQSSSLPLRSCRRRAGVFEFDSDLSPFASGYLAHGSMPTRRVVHITFCHGESPSAVPLQALPPLPWAEGRVRARWSQGQAPMILTCQTWR